MTFKEEIAKEYIRISNLVINCNDNEDIKIWKDIFSTTNIVYGLWAQD